MGKSKSMTGVIIALSVLLVLSLTFTIVFAYFSANRYAITTITFDAGIILEVSGIEQIGTSTNYVWMTDKTANNPTSANVSAGSSVINLHPIGIRVNGADAYVAVKPTINVLPFGKPIVAPDMESNWGQVGSSGWYIYKFNGTTASKMTVAESSNFVAAVKTEAIGMVGDINDYAGATYTCNLQVKASDTMEGLERLIRTNINSDTVLQYYYNDLQYAITGEGDLNSVGEVGENDASVVVDVVNGVTTISLLKNLELNETLEIQDDVVIDINGKELTSISDVAITVEAGNVVINGVEEGSKISVSNVNGQATILKVLGGECKIEGGTYETNTNGVATTENPNVSIVCEGGELDIENAEIIAIDSDDGVLYGVVYKSGTTGTLTSSSVVVDSPYGLNSYGINNEGSIILTECNINAYANYTANAAKTDYASSSRGVYNTGTAVFKNCTVYGAHSGITSKGALYIDGGTYEGYGHGGVYLSCEGKTSYFKNATFKDCEMKNGYIDDGVAGTNRAGLYIGGGSNITLYVDNCNFSGAYYPIVMRSSGYKVDGVKYYETNINVYISNSTIDFDRTGFRYIRVDASASANQKLHIGSGNNFTSTNGTYKESNTEATDVDYSTMFPNY